MFLADSLTRFAASAQGRLGVARQQIASRAAAIFDPARLIREIEAD
jgi:hypothetical protein